MSDHDKANHSPIKKQVFLFETKVAQGTIAERCTNPLPEESYNSTLVEEERLFYTSETLLTENSFLRGEDVDNGDITMLPDTEGYSLREAEAQTHDGLSHESLATLEAVY